MKVISRWFRKKRDFNLTTLRCSQVRPHVEVSTTRDAFLVSPNTSYRLSSLVLHRPLFLLSSKPSSISFEPLEIGEAKLCKQRKNAISLRPLVFFFLKLNEIINLKANILRTKEKKERWRKAFFPFVQSYLFSKGKYLTFSFHRRQ